MHLLESGYHGAGELLKHRDRPSAPFRYTPSPLTIADSAGDAGGGVTSGTATSDWCRGIKKVGRVRPHNIRTTRKTNPRSGLVPVARPAALRVHHRRSHSRTRRHHDVHDIRFNSGGPGGIKPQGLHIFLAQHPPWVHQAVHACHDRFVAPFGAVKSVTWMRRRGFHCGLDWVQDADVLFGHERLETTLQGPSSRQRRIK